MYNFFSGAQNNDHDDERIKLNPSGAKGLSDKRGDYCPDDKKKYIYVHALYNYIQIYGGCSAHRTGKL